MRIIPHCPLILLTWFLLVVFTRVRVRVKTRDYLPPLNLATLVRRNPYLVLSAMRPSHHL